MKDPVPPSQILGTASDHVVAFDSLDHRLDFGSLQVHPDAGKAFLKMRLAALKDQVDIQPVSTFRSFDRQLAIFNAKMRGERPVLDIHHRPVELEKLTPRDQLFAVLLWSALPGLSRHHWGSDLDIADACALKQGLQLNLVAKEYEDGGPCAKVTDWLTQYSTDFGFYFPYQSYRGGVGPEPWHISYWPLAQQRMSNFPLEALTAQVSRHEIAQKALIIQEILPIFETFFLKVNQPVTA